MFVAGQLPWDDDMVIVGPGDFNTQFLKTFENVEVVLSKAGASIQDVVKVRYYVTDQRFYPAHRELRARIWPENGPASAVMFVDALASTTGIIEVEVIAYTGKNRTVFQWSDDFDSQSKVAFSPAVQVEDIVFLAGQVSLNEKQEIVSFGDPEGQTSTVLNNIDKILKQTDISRSDVFKLFNFITYPHYADVVQRSIGERFAHMPASTTVTGGMGFPQLLVETEAYGVKSSTAEYLNSTNRFATPGGTQAVKVGNLLFTSGVVAKDGSGNIVGRGAVRTQITQIFTNMREILALANAELKDMLMIHMFVTSPAYIPLWLEVRDWHWEKYLGNVPAPASSTVAVSSLPSSDYLAQLEAIAVVE